MFTIKKYSLKGLWHIEIRNQKHGCSAIINLSQGASVKSLYLNNKLIIKSPENTPYLKSFASAILFPFSGRLADGKFSYNKINYQLQINELGTKNAIHGLVYNKEFTVIENHQSSDFSKLKLQYIQKTINLGFPFLYTIEVTYTLTDKKLTTRVHIINNDTQTFPFGIGWHPYFACSNLHNSSLKIDTNQKIIFNSQMIPEKVKQIPHISSEQKIANYTLDNCYISNQNCIYFKTPDYHIEINSSASTNYIQIYTPKDRKSIAIEPLTSPANSFNNKLGILELKPNQTHTIHWEIKLI